jgi:hypothetical protein
MMPNANVTLTLTLTVTNLTLTLTVTNLTLTLTRTKTKDLLDCKIYFRMQISIIIQVCQINFFCVIIVPGPFLRYSGEVDKNSVALENPGKIHVFLTEGGQYVI